MYLLWKRCDILNFNFCGGWPTVDFEYMIKTAFTNDFGKEEALKCAKDIPAIYHLIA